MFMTYITARTLCTSFHDITVSAGASPGRVSELAHLLQMPAKMAESLISKNPELQSVTVMQVRASQFQSKRISR